MLKIYLIIGAVVSLWYVYTAFISKNSEVTLNELKETLRQNNVPFDDDSLDKSLIITAICYIFIWPIPVISTIISIFKYKV